MSDRRDLLDKLHQAYLDTRSESLDIDQYTSQERADLRTNAFAIHRRWRDLRQKEFDAATRYYNEANESI